jgi:hypothetical protein
MQTRRDEKGRPGIGYARHKSVTTLPKLTFWAATALLVLHFHRQRVAGSTGAGEDIVKCKSIRASAFTLRERGNTGMTILSRGDRGNGSLMFDLNVDPGPIYLGLNQQFDPMISLAAHQGDGRIYMSTNLATASARVWLGGVAEGGVRIVSERDGGAAFALTDARVATIDRIRAFVHAHGSTFSLLGTLKSRLSLVGESTTGSAFLYDDALRARITIFGAFDRAGFFFRDKEKRPRLDISTGRAGESTILLRNPGEKEDLFLTLSR